MDNSTKQARCRLGLTQTEFAKLLGVSCPSVQRWEYGTTSPSFMRAEIINQTNRYLDTIKRKKALDIGDLLRLILAKNSSVFALHKFLNIIFDNPDRK